MPVFGALGRRQRRRPWSVGVRWSAGISVQVHWVGAGGRARPRRSVLSSSPRLATSQTRAGDDQQQGHPGADDRLRCRRLRAAAARSAISVSSRARAAARCRSLVDVTVLLLDYLRCGAASAAGVWGAAQDCAAAVGLAAASSAPAGRRAALGGDLADGQALDHHVGLRLDLARRCHCPPVPIVPIFCDHVEAGGDLADDRVARLGRAEVLEEDQELAAVGARRGCRSCATVPAG